MEAFSTVSTRLSEWWEVIFSESVFFYYIQTWNLSIMWQMVCFLTDFTLVCVDSQSLRFAPRFLQVFSPWVFFFLPHLAHLWANLQSRFEHSPYLWKIQQFPLSGRRTGVNFERAFCDQGVLVLHRKSLSLGDFKCWNAAAQDWNVPPDFFSISTIPRFPLSPWQTVLKAGSRASSRAK